MCTIVREGETKLGNIIEKMVDKMRKRKIVIPTIIICLTIVIITTFALLYAKYARQNAWLDASKPYDHLVSLQYSVGGGYGPAEEMISSQLIINFAENTIQFEAIRSIDNTVVSSWENSLEQTQLEELKSILISNDFLSLPESYGNDISLDAPYVSISLKTSETEHTTGGFMPGNERFRAIQSEIQAIFDIATP